MNFNIALSSNKRTDNVVQPKTDQPVVSNDQNQQQGETKITISNFIQQSAHPVICIFTIIFKISAIVSFILLDKLSGSEAMAYLVVILLGSVDFWITKNISGRMLVGLRWWNEVKEDGKEVWIFESKHESKNKYLILLILLILLI
jgi:hypothetical protein